MTFDIICKFRTENIFESEIEFIVDNPNDLIIRNKHICDIRHWGHIYTDTPLMISDAFAYGNKKSMKHYCSTYNWILENNLLLNGNYLQTFEIFLTDNILQYIFYKIPGGGDEPSLNRDQIIYKYNNNPNGIQIVYLNNINYSLIPKNIRSVNNFIVDKYNVYNYTKI